VPELTTVADDEAVAYDGARVLRWDGLEPGTVYDDLPGLGEPVRTLDRPPGERLATVTTVNDVHFGEEVAGIMHGFPESDTFRSAPGEPPYPETMNVAAVAEMAALDPDLVVVKGDLTSSGSKEEVEEFRRCYEPTFGERLLVVRGNHESYHGLHDFDEPFQERWLPGVGVALIDTSVDGRANGGVTAEQLEWLDELGARADRPVLVMGHHHAWKPGSRSREATYFGIVPDESERLVEVVARRPSLVAYLAGHTHRNRVRRFRETGDVPWVEVACVKDYPGAWAEYRVFEGGILQVFRRISTPEALAWTERTRGMFGGLYPQFAFGEIADRCFPILPRT
jgi:3',5'-cyclic-AMP phosphodiesterase